MKTGIQIISEERERQISKEGWTPDHDDEHHIGQLNSAARTYLVAADCLANASLLCPEEFETPESLLKEIKSGAFDPVAAWPWEWEWLKIDADPIRSLAKAGALIAAEIDRLQRRNEEASGRVIDKLKHSEPEGWGSGNVDDCCPDCGKGKGMCAVWCPRFRDDEGE